MQAWHIEALITSLCEKVFAEASSVMFIWTKALVNTILEAQRDLQLAVRSGNCGFVLFHVICTRWLKL